MSGKFVGYNEGDEYADEDRLEIDFDANTFSLRQFFDHSDTVVFYYFEGVVELPEDNVIVFHTQHKWNEVGGLLQVVTSEKLHLVSSFQRIYLMKTDANGRTSIEFDKKVGNLRLYFTFVADDSSDDSKE